MKSRIIALLESAGHTFDDCGAYNSDSCDYPDIAHAAAEKVSQGECERGILICGSGIGMSIAANKSIGVRAALCHDTEAAEMCRRHNNANMICLSADRIEAMEETDFQAVVNTWMTTEFEGGRHQRRVDKIELKSGCNS